MSYLVSIDSTDQPKRQPSLQHIIDTMQSWLDGEPVWPYDKIVEVWGPDFADYHDRMLHFMQEARNPLRDDFETMAERYRVIWEVRGQWIDRFGFAIPCAELLDELAKHQHVVEVGAGSGYMTRLMMNRGIDVIGSNPHRPNDYSFEHGKYAVLVARDAKTMVRQYPTSTIFCSWPTLKATWFRQALRAMQIGQKLVVIREDACAEETAWNYLDNCFEQIKVINIPNFEHMHDYASVHVKKRQR